MIKQQQENSLIEQEYFTPQKEQEEDKVLTGSIVCYDHPRSICEHICINKDCPVAHTFFCQRCVIKNVQKHQIHYEDIIEVKNMQNFENDLKENPSINFTDIQEKLNSELQSLEQIIDQQNQQIIEFITLELNNFKLEILEKYQQPQEQQQQAQDLLQQYNNINLPILQIKEILNEMSQKNEEYYEQIKNCNFNSSQKTEENQSNNEGLQNYKENLEYYGKKIKDLFWGAETQQNKIDIQNQITEFQQQDNVKQNINQILGNYALEVSEQLQNLKKLGFQLGFNQKPKDIKDYFQVIKQDYKPLIQFEKSTYKQSEQQVDISTFQENGSIKFQNKDEWKRVFSNSFHKNDLLIFKIKIPALRIDGTNNTLSFGVVEEQLKNYEKCDNFGSGNWLNINGDDHYKQFGFSYNKYNLSGIIDWQSDLLCIIQPSKSIFTIFDYSTTLVIKNQRKFENLDTCEFWNFHITDKYTRDIIIDNSINNNDVQIISQYDLL